MRNAIILLTACILECLGGIPGLDADRPVTKALRIRSTVVPPESLDYFEWCKHTGASRMDRTPPDYWKVIKENYIGSRKVVKYS